MFLDGLFSPNSPEAGPSYVGMDEGKGFNVNIAWNETGKGDEDYFAGK